MNFGRTKRLFMVFVLCAAIGGCSTIRQRRVANDQLQKAIFAKDNGNTQQAILALKQATKANPKLVPAHEMLGNLYKDTGDFDKAGQEYETLSQLQPKVASHSYNLALMEHLLGRLQRASEAYLKAIKLEPKNADAHMNLGLVYLAIGDQSKSIEHLQQAAELNPTSIDAWTNLGVALDDHGEPANAEKAYRKALELDGNRYNVFINYGSNLIHQNRTDEAIKLLQQAANIKDSALIQKLMGDALAKKGWWDAASGRYEKATKLDASYINAYNALGETLIAAYDRGMQLNESLRQRAVAAWKTSLSLRLDQPAVAAQIEKWSRNN